jgi:translocator protein
VLYIIIAASFGTVFYKVFTKEIPWIVAVPFVLNLIFNFAFTPLQFGLKNNLLAGIDIVLVLVTLIPYLLWVLFATTLQLTITYLNWA